MHGLVSLSGVVQGIFRYSAYQSALRIPTSKYDAHSVVSRISQNHDSPPHELLIKSSVNKCKYSLKTPSDAVRTRRLPFKYDKNYICPSLPWEKQSVKYRNMHNSG